MDTNTRTLQARAGGPALRPGLPRQLLTFGAIGVASTAAYAVLFLALRGVVPAVAANAAALVVTAIGNTAANRRLTFGVRDGGSMLRDQLGGLIALAVALVITTVAVSLPAALAPTAGRATELVVLVAANVLATVTRFLLLRAWIARAQPVTPRPAHAPALLKEYQR